MISVYNNTDVNRTGSDTSRNTFARTYPRIQKPGVYKQPYSDPIFVHPNSRRASYAGYKPTVEWVNPRQRLDNPESESEREERQSGLQMNSNAKKSMENLKQLNAQLSAAAGSSEAQKDDIKRQIVASTLRLSQVLDTGSMENTRVLDNLQDAIKDGNVENARQIMLSIESGTMKNVALNKELQKILQGAVISKGLQKPGTPKPSSPGVGIPSSPPKIPVVGSAPSSPSGLVLPPPKKGMKLTGVKLTAPDRGGSRTPMIPAKVPMKGDMAAGSEVMVVSKNKAGDTQYQFIIIDKNGKNQTSKVDLDVTNPADKIIIKKYLTEGRIFANKNAEDNYRQIVKDYLS